MIERERHAELDRILERVRRDSRFDFEATETFVRTAVLALGAGFLQQVLEQSEIDDSQPVDCPCGRTLVSDGFRSKTVRTILGKVTVRRRLFRCAHCGKTAYPADTALGISQTGFSPASRRMMARAGSQSPFAEAAEDLRIYAQLDVSAKDVERVAEQTGRDMDQWMQQRGSAARALDGQGLPPDGSTEPIPIVYVSFDGTGAPMRRSELTETKSKTPGQPAKTREVKLGCIFTQTTVNSDGYPVRDPNSTTYVGAIEDSTDFGYRILGEALRRGARRAKTLVVLTDGAAYNKSIAKEHFPNATHIIDLYHARERLAALAKLLLPESHRTALETQWRPLLDQGRIESLLAAVRAHLPRTGSRRKTALKDLHYFQHNASFLRYADFRAQGLFIGSGVVEAGCKTLIGRRLKQSGMFWSTAGANAIIAARCTHLSALAEQFWEDQAA